MVATATAPAVAGRLPASAAAVRVVVVTTGSSTMYH